MLTANKDPQFTKIQELVYELKVAEVMTGNLITVAPQARMSELRTILRDNRISGTPVVEGDRLVGLISVEDLITWFTGGGSDCSVERVMSQKVQTLFADEPLVHAVSKLEEYGYGRLPVLDRSTGALVGLITKGDVIEGLLRELQIDYHEEEIHRYRASHFFEDMIADKITVNFHYHIRGKKIEQGGEVASDLKRSLKRLGIHPDVVRRAAIATYEAEMNVIIYAEEGRVDVNVEPGVIQIKVRDKGQGIADVKRAIEPGYSTAPGWVRELGFGAGMGLPNIKNCARDFELQSSLGQGTILKIGIPTDVEEKQCA
jgi:CBS domain-containing protein/anti-sigma regulatory factor (Ser/Thr protein kinase)